jgi:hypothetical protein
MRTASTPQVIGPLVRGKRSDEKGIAISTS